MVNITIYYKIILLLLSLFSIIRLVFVYQMSPNVKLLSLCYMMWQCSTSQIVTESQYGGSHYTDHLPQI